jgi:hypothetical protein
MNIPKTCRQASFYMTLWLCAGALSTSNAQNAAPPSDAPFANATVVDFKGKVQIQLPGQALSAPTRGLLLPPESVISTDKGQILLRLEDGSDVLVFPHTRLVLKQPSASGWQRLQLLLGRIKAEVQKRIGGSPPFQIGTPSAVISVRGTRFYVEVDKHKVTEVDVEEGKVELENAKRVGAPVLIEAGFSSRVGEDSAPEQPQSTRDLHRKTGKSDNGNDQGKGAGNAPAWSNSHASPPGPRGRRP